MTLEDVLRKHKTTEYSMSLDGNNVTVKGHHYRWYESCGGWTNTD